MMVVGLPLTFLRQGQICTSKHLYEENVEKTFSHKELRNNGWNLQCMIKVVKRGNRKVQGVPQSQTEALPRHQEEEETDKTKQAQIEQTDEKH